MRPIFVTEVGPRSRSHSVEQTLPHEQKLCWIEAVAAGVREIQVSSFISRQLFPQMADAAEVNAYALQKSDPHGRASVLNLNGAETGFEAGVFKKTTSVSVTEAYSLANARKTHVQMIEKFRNIVPLRKAQYRSVTIEAGMLVAFARATAGVVSDDKTLQVAHTMAGRGVDEMRPSDASGYA